MLFSSAISWITFMGTLTCFLCFMVANLGLFAMSLRVKLEDAAVAW